MADNQHDEHWILQHIGKNPKQIDIFNAGTIEDGFKRYILVDGGRLNGKTVGVAHRVFRHLWETPGARFGIVSKTYKAAKQGGVWADLTDIAAPVWINPEQPLMGETGMPMEYTSRNGVGVGPAMDPLTRTPYFRVRNMYGGESECYLISLDNDNEIEQKLKSTRWSGLWISELSNFESRIVFDLSILQLRMFHLSAEQHIWIADTNPPEIGEDAWFYKLWYEEIIQENHPRPGFQKALRHIHVKLEDNIAYLSPIQVDALKGTYANDPGEYARHVDGEYVKGHGTLDKHFADVIIPDIHYIEPAIGVDKTTDTLYTGWDPGDINHSGHILERRIVNDVAYWMVLEEVVVVGDRLRIEDFAYMMWEKMLALQHFYKKQFEFVHWADDTAVNAFRSQSGGYDADAIFKATNGNVLLQGAAKPDGSVRDSVRILRRFLRDERLFVGRNCPQTIDMLEGLRVSKDPKVVVDDGPLKHPFDSLRYPIYMVERLNFMADSTPRGSDRSRLVHA